MRENVRMTVLCFVLLLLVIVPLFSLGISNHGLWSADEPRVAEIGREMAITGNWTVPMLNKKPFLEQPPLYYGLLALTFKAFGASDKVARIPSAVFAFLTVILVFVLANTFFGPRVALLSGIILATGGEYYRVAHWVLVDSTLTFFVVASVASFTAGYAVESHQKKFFWYLLFYVSCTLAFYTKGFIGIIMPALAVLSFLAFNRNLKELVRMRVWFGAIVFIAMTLPWFYALWQQADGAEFLKVIFIQNHLQRFVPASLAGGISALVSGHHHPFYYYLTEFPNGFLPWSILLVPVFLDVFSRLRSVADNPISKNGTLLAICWFVAGIVFLSAASTKRTLYLMPIFAPVSMLTAVYIDSLLTKGSINRLGKAFALLFSAVMLLMGLSLIIAHFYFERMYLIRIDRFSAVSTIITAFVIVFLSVMSIKYLRRLNL
ncbi:MAG TPA: phospholipid carrier-dependent glycosyltransferase, partial [Syntrophorhabdaceae bacterium]|nr:phospholipid carrier-dependent glycosyltransferase [Syntrophorhabdaceae bacterium]